MDSHPINLAVRFILELAALAIMGIWGWKQGNGWLSYILVIGIPALAAVIWGVFAVPNDPSRSGAAPVVVSGIIRLIMELIFFAFATWAFYDLGYTFICLIFGVLVIIHYIISYDRIMWLMER